MEDWRWWAMAAKIRGYLGFFWMFVQRLFSQCFFKCQSKKPHWIPYWCQLLGQL
jgi:methylphosphotriester-DNA--protein-cysteine methyltransferase